MSSDNDNIVSLTDRVASLEQSNGVLRVTSTAACLLALVAIACSFIGRKHEPTPGKVVAEEFVLVDSSGNERGQWAVENNTEGPGLQLTECVGSMNACHLRAMSAADSFFQTARSRRPLIRDPRRQGCGTVWGGAGRNAIDDWTA